MGFVPPLLDFTARLVVGSGVGTRTLTVDARAPGCLDLIQFVFFFLSCLLCGTVRSGGWGLGVRRGSVSVDAISGGSEVSLIDEACGRSDVDSWMWVLFALLWACINCSNTREK